MLTPTWLGVNGRFRQAKCEAPSPSIVAFGLHFRQHRVGAGKSFLTLLGRRPKPPALKQEARRVLDLSLELAVSSSSLIVAKYISSMPDVVGSSL